MIYEVTSAGHVRRYTPHEEPCCHLRRTSSDVVLVDRDFHEVSAAHPGAVYFQLHRDVAELMRTWDVALYARVKRTMPRIFETAVCLLMLSDMRTAHDARPPQQHQEDARPECARPPQQQQQEDARPECARPPQQEAHTNPREQIRWAISVLRKYNVECSQR